MEREGGHSSKVKGHGNMQLTFKKELVKKKNTNKKPKQSENNPQRGAEGEKGEAKTSI